MDVVDPYERRFGDLLVEYVGLQELVRRAVPGKARR
jgi:hypothetical protein